ncbi:MAG: IS4 family transposase [Lamprobacter sp.]|uniref:IS4 family transposase n=1 Tax=Lamprobacter sp. TaxID=3100796 RepID=UPI002B263D05|nr:IS4 family transposase [Lamprobacter sp.]MEA3644000.1 IS4 family transposase [Lamprobacter sp.]
MHALTILQRCVAPLLIGIHRRRLSVLLEAVAATVSGPRLTLTEIGRRFSGVAALRHRIKRADRLLGNRPLQRDAKLIYGALARMLLAKVAEPLIVIDWSDLKADQSLPLLRASLPVGGRSLTLYEEVHAQRNLGNRRVQHRFLQQLKTLLPVTADPIIVADSGFKVPFYREVERLGWRWVGRVRGRDFIQLKSRWRSCKRVFEEATCTPSALGIGEWVRSHPLRATFVLVRKPRQGRRQKTASGKRSRTNKRLKAARNAREPWLLVASTRLADWSAKHLVKVYRQRMQIELSFRDMKSPHFGEGLECSASSGVGRFTVLVLIASLAAILLWLIGTAAEHGGVHERLRPGSRKRRAYSRLFLARLLLTMEHCRTTIAELVDAIGPLDQWVASDHDALLAE